MTFEPSAAAGAGQTDVPAALIITGRIARTFERTTRSAHAGAMNPARRLPHGIGSSGHDRTGGGVTGTSRSSTPRSSSRQR
jgi:hypothetical protein